MLGFEGTLLLAEIIPCWLVFIRDGSTTAMLLGTGTGFSGSAGKIERKEEKIHCEGLLGPPFFLFYDLPYVCVQMSLETDSSPNGL